MDQHDFYKAKLDYETDAADLHAALEKNENIGLIDARSDEAYQQEHIPSAISFPHRTMTEKTTGKLSKAITYVTYCDGVGCNASTRAAIKLLELGFNVKELSGGLDWWKRDGYATEGQNARQGKPVRCGC